MDIFQPSTSQQKSSLIRQTLREFYEPLKVDCDVCENVQTPTGKKEDEQYWILIDLFVPTNPNPKERQSLRQNYMTEVDKLVYGAMQRKNWKFDSFSTDQGDRFDCVLTKIFFKDEIKGR